jgi:Fur family zinc uptake transcriptional regulator
MNVRVIAPFHGGHDHDQCLADAVERAERVCRANGLRFTRLRRHVLELVWRSHKPVGAYEIMEGLRRLGHRPAPPTAYRALEFLHQAGLVHRIESLNAFVGCADPETAHGGQFLICDQCHRVAEIDDRRLSRQIARHAGELGFTSRAQTIEIHGRCAECESSD